MRCGDCVGASVVASASRGDAYHDRNAPAAHMQVLEPYYLATDELWNRLQTVNELITDTEARAGPREDAPSRMP